MKKAITLFSLSAVLSMAAVGAFGKLPSKELLADGLVPATDGLIEINQNFFENWTNDAGSFGDKDSKFWDDYHYFNSLGSFFRGESKEGWTGTLKSNSWVQTTQYIYFTWSAANNTDDVKLIFHCGDEDGENPGTFEYTGEMKNDTFVENPMMLRYFKIPDEQYAALIAAHPSGFNMRVYLKDNKTADYGFNNFGYLHVNQTEEQVSDAMRFYLNSLDHDGGEWQVNKRKDIFNHYTSGNADLKRVFYRTVSSVDEDFEDNDDFLNHWYFDYNYFNGANWGLHFDRAIGSDTFRPDDNTKMPFNKTDNGYFRGWFENNDLGGFVSGDASIYRFVSRPFVLGGTGLVSIKMAGTASLHVIDPATRQDLAWADCQTFNTSGNQADLMDGSFNTVTMVRHVINLEAYVGKTIQLAIADVSDGGWSALYADELITDYQSYPGFKVDAFNQTNNGGSHDIYKADRFVNATQYNAETNANGMRYVGSADINKADDNAILNHVDNSPANAAFKFLDGEKGYYKVMRGNAFDYANANADDRNNVLNAYIALSANAQGIVCSSKDILSATNTSQDISVALEPYLDSFSKFNVSFNANGGTGSGLDSFVVVGGSKYNLPDNSFTFEGKKFVGWKVNNSGDLLQPNAQITISEDSEIYAIWENTAQTDVENLETTSALSYAYTKASEDNYSFTSAKITFGGSVSVSLWNKLDEESEHHIEGFGVLVADTATLGENALTPETAAHDMFISVETKSTPTLSDDETNYVWTLRLNLGNATENYDDAVTAIAYVKVNGNYIYLQQSEQSVVSLANDYIEHRGYSAEDFEGSLGALADLGQ